MGRDRAGTAGDEQLAEFVRELRLMRTLVREVGESFILRREGEIETLLAYAETLPRKEARERLPEWLRQLHGLKLKPHKGRLRDLKALDRLIEELTGALIQSQENGERRPRKGASVGSVHLATQEQER